MVDDRWHRRMFDALQSFHPDHLEELRQKQKSARNALWEYNAAYSVLETLQAAPPCSPNWRPQPGFPECQMPWKIDDANDRLRIGRDALRIAIQDGPDYCPTTASGETPCDWAPSLAVASMHRRFETKMTRDYGACLEKVGGERLSEIDLEDEFLRIGEFVTRHITPASSCYLVS